LVAVVGYTTPPVGLTDLDQFIIQSTRFGSGGVPDWTLATQWQAQSADKTGTLDTNIIQPSVLAATTYWVRAYAVDSTGNRQATPSNTITLVTDSDNEGPTPPSGIQTYPGNNTFAVNWDPNPAPDLAYVEVQWRVTGSGASWSAAQVLGTVLVVAGVSNGASYDVRVRSVDTSGNTLNDTGADDSDGNNIYETVKVADAVNNGEKGWVTGGTVSPTAIPADTLVWTNAMIANLFAGKLSADWLTAGSLHVGAGVGQVVAITVVDSGGNPIGTWDTNGIALLDPTDPTYKMTLDEDGLFIWDLTNPALPVAVVSITPLGIDASSVTFGKMRGGHNLVQNSSFELGAFSAQATTNNTWDLAADWNAAGSRQGADINLTTGASTITMTAI
jgi:hypothetical protein